MSHTVFILFVKRSVLNFMYTIFVIQDRQQFPVTHWVNWEYNCGNRSPNMPNAHPLDDNECVPLWNDNWQGSPMSSEKTSVPAPLFSLQNTHGLQREGNRLPQRQSGDLQHKLCHEIKHRAVHWCCYLYDSLFRRLMTLSQLERLQFIKMGMGKCCKAE
jgi:hypothetical protein